MNITENTKAFDLELAKDGHPLVTRDGIPVTFIAHVPEAKDGHKVVGLTANKNLLHWSESGTVYHDTNENDDDLFLAPLGYCESIPVFAGDKLTGTANNQVYKGKEFIAHVGHNNFEQFKWPSKSLVVKSKMSWEELHDAYEPKPDGKSGYAWNSEGCVNLANSVLEHSIKDGDVIPTSVVLKLMGDAFNRNYQNGNKSFSNHAQDIINEYIKEVKE